MADPATRADGGPSGRDEAAGTAQAGAVAGGAANGVGLGGSTTGSPGSRAAGSGARSDGTGGWSDGGVVRDGSGSGPARSDAGGSTRDVAALGAAGGEPGVPVAYREYARALRRQVQQRLVYPRTAVQRRLQGVVELEVRVDAGGELSGVEVVAGASAPVLGRAAERAVRDAAPFPFPDGLAPRQLTIRLPIIFELR